MEGSRFASSSPAQQEDSWTCQRCGWVYPNAHPSAKHRRNHKKHCGKIKGFELHSEVQKGGSSDEASSDDSSHVNKESSQRQYSQAQHESNRPVVPGDVVRMAEPPSALQSRELLIPETNVSDIIKAETPVHTISGSLEVKPEVTPYESMQNVDLTESETSAAEHIPNIGPCDKTAKTIGDGMDVKIKDLAGESPKIAVSGVPEGCSYEGFVSAGLEKVDAAVKDSPALVSNQIDGAVQGASMHENSGQKHAGSMASSDEPSRKIEEEGRVSLSSCVKDIEESGVLDSYQLKEKQKSEIFSTPVDHSVNRKGSSQEEDSWTCHRCGWVYPNPHPSAKHRRNHKKHCGKLKGFEVQAELHKGGSSDEVSSDEEKKEHILHESSSIIQAQNPAGGSTATVATGTATSSGDQSSILSTSRENFSAERLPEGPDIQAVLTSTESSDIHPRCAVSPSEENLEGQGQGKGAAAGNYTTKALHDSDGPEIFQSKEEIPSSQEHVLHESSSIIQAQHRAGGSTATVATGTATSSGDQSSILSTSRENSSAERLPEGPDIQAVITSTESSDIHPRCAVSPSEENLEGQGQGKGAAAGNYTTKDLHDSDGPEIFQSKEEIPSSQAISTERELNAILPSSAVSEGLGYLVTDTSKVFGSTSKFSDTPHGLTGDSMPNVENSLALNVLPSADTFPPADVTSSNAEEHEMVTVVTPISHPRVSGLANESLEAFGGTESNRDGHPNESTDEAEKLDLVKPSGLAGETLDRKFSSNFPPVFVAGNAPHEEAESFSVEDSSVQQTGLPLEALSAANITRLGNDLEGEKKMNGQATSAPVECLSKDEVSGGIVGDAKDASSFSIKKIKTPQETEIPVQSLENRTPQGEVVSEKRTTPVEIHGEKVSIIDAPTAMVFSSESKIIPECVPLASGEDTQATIVKDEVSGQTVGGLEETSTSSVSKVVERPQVTGIPAQSWGNPGAEVAEVRRATASTTGELLLSDAKPSSTTIESKSEASPESGSPGLVGDTLATSTIMNVANNSGLSSLPKSLEIETTAVGETVLEERFTPADISGEAVSIHSTPTPMAFSETNFVPERAPESKIISESVPLVSVKDKLATGSKDEVLNQTDGDLEETSTSSISKVVPRPHVTEIPAQSVGFPGVDVSEERNITYTTAEPLLSDDRLTSTTIESKAEAISERGLPAQVGDSIATSTIVNIADNPGLSNLTEDGDSKQSFLVKEVHEDKTAVVSSHPLEALEKSDIKDNTFCETDFGSSGRSLDGTNSFTKAESEFSQRSEFAASSHKLSDSLEIFEDAPDTLDACSVGGSIEESESLDESRQEPDGVPDSKLLRNASSDERAAGPEKPYVMNGATDELEQKPNTMNAGKESTEMKATTIPAGTSYSVPAKIDELKAPSPEAWQEPGHSALVKEGKKIITSEVMEDDKSSESHTALRSLMAREGKDKMDQQAVTSSVIVADPQISDVKEASANGKKPKSRSRSFWSHCICCPAVH